MEGICGRIERNVVYLLLEQQQNNKSTCHSERSAKHVVEVFVRERAARGDEPSKNRGANATKGYGLDFGWLSTVNVTFRWQATEILSHIPLRLKASRFCSFASLNPQKFDFGRHSCLPSLRMTYKGIFCLILKEI